MPQLTFNNGNTDVAAKTLYLLKDGVAVSQERGVSTADVMSQNAVTKELQKHDTQIYDLTENKANKSELEENYLSKAEAEKEYLKKDEIPEIPEQPDLTPYALKDEIPVNVSELINDAEYVTPTYLSKYYTIDEINGKLTELKGDTEAWLFNFYDKEEINDIIAKSKEDSDILASKFEGRISSLETIRHEEFATKEEVEEELTGFVKNEKLDEYYTGSQVDDKIAEAIAGENIGSLLTKSEAEETYQPKGEYLTQHQSLDDYYTKEETDKEIDDAVNVLKSEIEGQITDLNVSQYATTEYVDATFQPKGEYLTEHQDISHLQTIEKAEKEHAEMQEFSGELETRMEIVERLSANFQTFTNWQSGYYEPTDTGLNELKEHESCYCIIADVSNIRRDEFFAHYAPTGINNYIWEYSGEPAANTFIKATAKNNFDLVFELDRNTKYVVAFGLLPVIGNDEYYLRGIKSEDAGDYVKREEFTELETRVTSLENKDSEIPEIDLEGYVKKDEFDELEANLKNISNSKLTDWIRGKYVMYSGSGQTGSVFSNATYAYMIVDVSDSPRELKAYLTNATGIRNGMIAEYEEYPDFLTTRCTHVTSYIGGTNTTDLYDITLQDSTRYIVVNTNDKNNDSYVEIVSSKFKCDINSKRIDEVEERLSEIDLSKYATVEYVDNAISNLDITGNSDNEELKLITCDMEHPNKMVVYFQPGRYVDIATAGTNNLEYPDGVYYSLFAAPGDSYSSQAIKVIFNDAFTPVENNYLYEFMSYPTAQNFIGKKEIKPDTKEIELTVGAKYFYIESGSGDYNQCDFEYVSTHLGTVYNSLAMNINTNVSKINNEINSKTSLGIENQEYTLENNGHFFNGTDAGKYTIVKDLDSWTGNIKFRTTTDTIVWIALYNEEDITMMSGAYWSMQASTFTDFNLLDNFVDITQAKALVVCSDRTDSDLTFEIPRFSLVKNAVIKMQDELKGIDKLLSEILG